MIKTQPFGRTSHDSTRTIFGSAALWNATQTEGEETLQLLTQHGVNHIDTAISYGRAERVIGTWMDDHRQDFFLATKTDKCTREKAWDQLETSLDRLRVDSVDLWQLHNLVDPDEWQTAMGPGGALEAAVEARERGLVRFIGVTGHGTTAAAMHIRSLERFDFDTVLLPYNYLMMQNPQYRADFDSLRSLCQERNVAVQTIKSIARGAADPRRAALVYAGNVAARDYEAVAVGGEAEKPAHTTWYPPLTDQEDIDKAVHWLLGSESVFLNTVGDLSLLPLVLDAASRFTAPPSGETMEEQIVELQMIPVFPEVSET